MEETKEKKTAEEVTKEEENKKETAEKAETSGQSKDEEKEAPTNYVLDGFFFEKEEIFEIAKKEDQAVKLLASKLRAATPEQVLKIYNQAIDQNLFRTPVGLFFLRRLQEYLRGQKNLDTTTMHPIFIGNLGETHQEQRLRLEKERKETDYKLKVLVELDRKGYRRKFHIALYFCVVFLVMIAGMFMINHLSKDNINIVNYENQIIDKYEDWQISLEAQEQALKEREAELAKKEQELKNK